MTAREGSDRGELGSLPAAFAAAPVGIAVFDPDLRCVDATPQFGPLIGCDGAATVGTTVDDMFGPADAERVRAVLDAARRGGEQPADVELRLTTGGRARWVLLKAFSATDERSSEALVGLTVTDVSPRRVSEEQHATLQQLTAEFGTTLDPDAVAEVVIRAVGASVGASGGALYLVDESRTRLVALRTGYPWPTGSPMFDVPLDADMPLASAVRGNHSEWVNDEADLLARFPGTVAFMQTGQHWGAHAALPLTAGGQVLGVMVLSWSEPRTFSREDRSFLEAVAGHCAQGLDRASLFERERTAREHTERVAGHVLRLERITGALAAASEPEEVIERFLDECLDEIGASYGAVLVLDAAQRALVPLGSRTTDAWTPRSVLLDGPGPLAESVRTKQSILLEDREQIRSMVSAENAPLTVEQAWAVVPLVAYSEVLGVVALRYDGARTFDVDDRAFLDRVGRRLAEAIDRSRLYAHQRDAREQAEAAARWLRSVQSLAAALARSATRREVARALREHLHPATRADFSIVAALSSDRRSLDVLTGTSTFAMPTEQLGASVQGVVRESILRGRSIELADPAEIQSTFPGLVDAGLGSFTLLPVRSGRRVIAVIGLGWSTPAAITADARRLLAIAVSLGGAAFERAAAYDLDHHIAETLQTHLLTAPELDLPGLAWAARYSPGSVELTAGGDWYDVIQLSDGRVALVVGDIVGHGIMAAAAMGQVRSATRALAAREDSVGVLEALDEFVSTTGQGHLSSLALLVIDAANGSATCALAGHPAPLIRRPDGSSTFLEDARGPLLGIAPPGTRSAAHLTIEPGSSVVLYTDGLIERRGESIDAGMSRLAGIVARTEMALHPEGMCDRLLERLAAGGQAPDDITLLVATLEPAEVRRRMLYPARLEMLRVIRTELRSWLVANGVDATTIADVVLACDEACANSVEHGMRAAEPGTIEVALEMNGDDILVTVADPGSWSDRESGDHRGRGMHIMRVLMDDVDVTTGAGTTVKMRRRRRASV